MRTAVPEKILRLIDDLDADGHAPLTRLTVLTKWFERPGRLPAFGLWIARRAAGRKGKTTGEAGALLDEARALLGTASTRESLFQRIDPTAAQNLLDRAQTIPNRPLELVAQGLALHLGRSDSPADGCKLAADWAQHVNPRDGPCLRGPSRGKLQELVRFMFSVEALEDGQ